MNNDKLEEKLDDIDTSLGCLCATLFIGFIMIFVAIMYHHG